MPLLGEVQPQDPVPNEDPAGGAKELEELGEVLAQGTVLVDAICVEEGGRHEDY